MNKIKELWLRLSLENRKRIVSFVNTFIVTFLMLLAARLDVGLPETWEAMAALIIAVSRTAVREAINELVHKLS